MKLQFNQRFPKANAGQFDRINTDVKIRNIMKWLHFTIVCIDKISSAVLMVN